MGYLPVFSFRFDPYDATKLITCGYEHMAMWKLKGTHLSCATFQRFFSSKTKKAKMAKENLKNAAAD